MRPISHTAISKLATKYLLMAGIQVSRPLSHPAPQWCCNDSVDADFSLKTIGDFVGHRSPKTTEIYTKVAVESLREVALGDGEEVLGVDDARAYGQPLRGAQTRGRATSTRRAEEAELRLLVRFARGAGASPSEELTPVLLDDFLASRSRPRPRGFDRLLGVVRRLLDWAVARELLEASPLQTRPRRETAKRIPFLFDITRVRRLLDAAAALPDCTQAPTR